MRILLIASLLTGHTAVLAADVKDDKVAIKNAWIRAVLPVQKTSALYFSIHNSSGKTLTLVDVETSVAERTMFHATIEDNGVAKMRHRVSVTIGANETVEFQPGGLHVMLMGLNHPLTEGKTVNVVLHFESGEQRQFEVMIKRST